MESDFYETVINERDTRTFLIPKDPSGAYPKTIEREWLDRYQGWGYFVTDDQGLVLEEGDYKLYAQAVDFLGNVSNTAVTTMNMKYGGTRELWNVLPYPNPWSPSESPDVKIHYILNKPATQARLVIADAAGSIVKLLKAGPAMLTMGAHDFHWDGRNSVGDLVVNGTYYFRLVVVDNSGYIMEAKGHIAVLK